MSHLKIPTILLDLYSATGTKYGAQREKILEEKKRWQLEQYREYMARGDALFQKREWADAVVEYSKALTFWTDEKALQLKVYCENMVGGMRALEQRKLGKAHEYFTKAVDTRCDTGPAKDQLALLEQKRKAALDNTIKWINKNRWSDALIQLHVVNEIRRDDESVQLLDYCTSIKDAVAARARKDYRTASTKLRAAIETGKDTGFASAALEELQKIRSSCLSKAQKCIEEKRWNAAIQELNIARDIQPDNETDRVLSYCTAVSSAIKAIAKGDLRLAVVSLRSAIETRRDTGFASAELKGLMRHRDSLLGQAEKRIRDEEWMHAVSILKIAAAIEDDGQITRRIEYCQAVSKATNAMTRKDYSRAVKNFRLAFKTGEDRGIASRGLAKLESLRRDIVVRAERELRKHEWRNALRLLGQAEKIESKHKQKKLKAYLYAVIDGEEAIQKENYSKATTCFERAVHIMDVDGYARGRIKSLETRIYWVKIDKILVHPMKTDKVPWDPTPNKFLTAILQAGKALGPLEGHVAIPVIENLNRSIPVENRPDVKVWVRMPHGRIYVSEKENHDFFVASDVAFTVEGNHFTKTPIEITIWDNDKDSDDLIGRKVFYVGDLIAGGEEKTWRFDRIIGLTISIRSSGEDMIAGIVREASPKIPDDESEWNLASARTRIRPGCTRRFLFLREFALMPVDYHSRDPFNGKPDPYVEIIVNGLLVFKTRHFIDKTNFRWTSRKGPKTLLFIRPEDEIEVRVVDKDPDEDDILVWWKCRGTYFLKNERIVFQTRGGGHVLFDSIR